MMPVLNGAMLAVSSSLAASIAAKATVTAALGLTGARLAHRNRAAVRHALLAAAFGVLLVLPIACLVAPPVRIAAPVMAQDGTSAPSVAGAIDAISFLAPASAGVRVTPAIPQSSRLSPSSLLIGVWVAGVAFSLLPMILGLWQVRSLRRSGLPWLRGQPVVERLALDSGIHRRVEVLLHEALPGPMTCGVAHAAIVLPEDAQTWDDEDLNRAIVHELEHVRRGDRVSQCLARAVCAVYWFHPLVWMAWRQLALEAERSCDDAVLRRSEATAYADQLVGLARRLSSSAKSKVAKSPLLAMANRADLTARVKAVLDSGQLRGRAGALPVALAFAAAAVLVITMSPLTVVAAPQFASAQAVSHDSPPAEAQPPNAAMPLEAVPVKTIDANSGSEHSSEHPDGGLETQQQRAPEGQTTPKEQSFEVAMLRLEDPHTTVNYNGPDSPNQSNTFPTNRLTMFHTMLKSLIAAAYGIPYNTILGGPAWLDSQHYDLSAKVEGNARLTRKQMQPMLQNLLKERLHLVVHSERRIVPGYEMVIAKGGSKLKPNAGAPFGGIRGIDELKFQNVSAEYVAQVIETAIKQPVVDKSGLGGMYDFDLKFAPENGPGDSPSSKFGSIFSAIQEQLGLKLVGRKVPVNYLIIDGVEKVPTEN